MTVETRRVKDLIDEVRFNTNNTDDNRFDDSRLIKFFNSAQRQIQKIIYNSNPVNSPFAEEYQIPLAAGVNAYDLPEDIFAVASVRNVTPVTFNGKATQALKHISLKEINTQRGYYLRKNVISFAPSQLASDYLTIVVTYDKALEEITSVNDNIPLPATCEDFLMAFVERKINYVDSSKDISNSQIFTQEEKEELEGMFRQDLKEVLYPAIVDETYYN
jgi:hypothetical protein